MSRLEEAALIRRVYDRFGFGPAPGELATGVEAGLDGVLAARWRQLASPSVLAPPSLDQHLESQLAGKRAGAGGSARLDPADKKARNVERQANARAIESWWTEQLVTTSTQLAERLTWFWHGHFATSLQKVKIAGLMLGQNTTFRTVGVRSFRPLAQAMIIDPAMLIWLDGPKNTLVAPNENLGREFMELFTLGHGSYTEDDVKAAARALTGWTLTRPDGRVTLRPRRHDDGSKTILGHTEDFDARSFVDLVCDQPKGHAFVISRLWARLVSGTPPTAATLEKLGAAWGTDGNLPAVLRAIAADPAFADGGSSLVKQPVEWAVGTLRAFGVKPSDLPGPQARQLANAVRGMGQVPFLPPSVGGWPAGQAWLTTAAALSRTHAARLITAHADLGEVTSVSTRNRPEALRRLLGIDRLSPRSSDAIAGMADRPAVAAAVAACTPEYVISA